MNTAIQNRLRYTGLFLLILFNINTISAQIDTIAPVITLIGKDTVRIEVGSTYIDSGATAFDISSGDLTSKIIMTSNLDVNITGIYTVEFNVKDSSGNSAIPVFRVIIVMNDLTKPKITLNPGANGCIELSCANSPYVDPGATASDNKAPFNLTSSIIVSGNVDTRKIGTYTLTYNVQDPAGNKAIPVTRNVCVEKNYMHGFIVTPISGGFRIWTDDGLERDRSNFKWNIDGKYLNGYDNVQELFYYTTDTIFHQVCMDETFCDDDTSYSFCKIIGDSIVSPIIGKIFIDSNNNCQYDFSEKNLNNIPVKLLDSTGKLVAISYSLKGDYAFQVDYGKYKVELNDTKTPIEIKCLYPGKDTLIEFKKGNSEIKKVDFPVVCKPGFDIGVINRLVGSFARPGRTIYVNPWIGDFNSRYGNGCSSDKSGKIKISVNGKVHFSGVDTNALNPDSINGKEFVYQISNFSTLKKDDINLIFVTDTLANLGDTIKVTINVTPEIDDINTENNNVIHYYIVSTSYDPNIKEVYPVDVEPKYSDWLTYTVHFQNTGNDTAFKVRITDTLDEKLDPESFEVLGYSHPVQVRLNRKALVFNFPDINLPDSNSNEKQSHGYIQYRIKPVKNLPEGTKIYNTAYIFFDYNAPIVTNTTVNTFVAPIVIVGINSEKLPETFKLYPNPSSGLFTIEYEEAISTNASIEIYDLYGALVYSCPFNSQNIVLDMKAFANGFYVCKLNTGSTELYKTFVKQ